MNTVKTFYGEDYDATVYTNGGTYHKVIVEHIDDGSREIHKFFNRDKAIAFAKGAAK